MAIYRGRQPGISTAQDLVGAEFAAVRKRQTAIEDKIFGDEQITVDYPQKDPAYTTAFDFEKKKVLVSDKFLFPGDTRKLYAEVIADRHVTNQAKFDKRIFPVKFEAITNTDRAAGYKEGTFKHHFDSDTEYHVFRLGVIAENDFGKKTEIKDPEGDLVYTDPPLYSFTTPPYSSATIVEGDDVVLSAKHYQGTSHQLIAGGTFLHNANQYDAGFSANNVGYRWHVAPDTGADKINKLASGAGGNSLDAYGIQWDEPNHRLLLATNMVTLGGEICSIVPNKTILPGQTYAMGVAFKTTSSYTLDTLLADLFDQGGGGSIIITAQRDNIVFTTDWLPIVAIFEVPDTYQQDGKQWIRWRFNSDPSQITYMDDARLRKGPQDWGHSPHSSEDSLEPSTPILVDTGIGAVGAQGIGVNVSGDGSVILVGEIGFLLPE